MQGPVYGISTELADLHQDLCPNFHYDDIFGTVVNRFLVQAVAKIPLTIYGKGGQTRGYLNLLDTMQCLRLASEDPAKAGELRIFNQLTETFSVNELAAKIQVVGKSIGLDVEINNIPNPRMEREDHYYNPVHRGLSDLGLKPNLMTEDVIAEMLRRVIKAKTKIIENKILPRVNWK
jgi:UDP-sulfoquinovose synthase